MEREGQDQSGQNQRSPGTVAVTGATGFVGRHIVEMLLGRGYRVRALTRSVGKARDLFPQAALDAGEIKPCGGTLSDPDALNSLVKGCTACIHLVGIIREEKGQTFESVHIDGTRAIVNACKNTDPSMRYVHMSALGVGPDNKIKYRETKHRAEQVVRGSSLRWTIVRPGLIHGPDGDFTQMAVEWARGQRFPYVFLPYFLRWREDGFGYEPPTVAPVYVEDVARVFVEAIGNRSSIGKAYDLSGSQRMLFPEMLRAYAASLSPRPRNRPAVGMARGLAAAQARIAGAVGMGGLLPFDEGMAIMGGRDSVSDNEAVIRDFGFTPAGFDEALSRYARDL